MSSTICTDNKCINCNNNVDMFWSKIGEIWLSKKGFALDFADEDDADAWSDIESVDSFDCFTTRKRKSWQDIAKECVSKEVKKEASKEVKKEVKEYISECAICYECFMPSDACSTTPCGHKFHSSCLFQNFEHRPECPMCRSELIKQPEEKDDDDESFYSEDDEDDDDEEESIQKVSIKQMADKLTSLGYTMEDLLMFQLGGSNHPTHIENPRWHGDLAQEEVASESTTILSNSIGSHILEYNEYEKTFYPEPKGIMDKLSVDIDNMLEGKLSVNYKDTRTYAQVLATNQ